MAKYRIDFNQNGDSLEVLDQVGDGIGADVLWKFANDVVAKVGPARDKGYAVDSINRTDATEEIRRPG